MAFRETLDQLLAWRRDVRHFQTRSLPDGMLDQLIEIACRGPSVGNAQPWRFVRILSPDRRIALADRSIAEKCGGRRL